MKIIILVALVFVLLNCGKNSITLEIDTSGGVIDLSNQLPGAWTKVCVLPPYSTNKTAKELLGFEYDIEFTSAIYSSDTISLLLTATDKSVLQGFEVKRSNADFSNLGAKCYSRDNAIFKVEKDGWPKVSHT
jgi:hypothetical protein